jgi:putative tricarboxylic transport membrane protein
MNRVDQVVGCLAILASAPLAVVAWQLGPGNPKLPGPGFWPLILAFTLAGLGGILFFRPDLAMRPVVTGVPRWSRFALALVTLFAYVLILSPLGYLGATLILLLIQLRWVENQAWRKCLPTAVLAAVVSFFIFRVLFKVPLPVGIMPLPQGW